MPRQPKYVIERALTLRVLGANAFRIRAARAIPEHGVRAGDLGGFVESEANLSQDGSAWISNDAMAVGRSRVEQEAIMADRSILSGHAQLAGSARMSDLSRGSGQTVIRGNSRMSGLAHATDDTTVDGSIVIGHGASLIEDTTYACADDTPWRFSLADPRNADYSSHILEALDLDDALIQAFAHMGAQTPQERHKEALQLLNTPEGSKALHRIAVASGGTFHPNRYIPLDARSISAENAAQTHDFLSENKITGWQALCSVNPTSIISSDTGHLWYAGVLQSVSLDGGILYCPAICEDANEVDAIVAMPLKITPIPLQFRALLDAEAAAQDRINQLHSIRQHIARSEPISETISHLPTISRVQRGKTSSILDAEIGREYATLILEHDAAIQCDIQGIVDNIEFQWRPTRMVAVNNPHRITLELPPPTEELLRVLNRAESAKSKEGSIIMKRDMDLVRSILLDIEENQNINGHFVLSDADFSNLDADRSQVQYHLRLLMDAGYIEGKDLLNDGQQRDHTDPYQLMKDSGTPISVERMTWEGHDFLDTVRDNGVWQKTKGYLGKFGGFGVDVVKDVAKAVVKGQLADLGLSI